MKSTTTNNKRQHTTRPVRPADDRLLLIEEVADLRRTTVDTERWRRSHGKAPYYFRAGRRVVAWRSEVIAYLDAEREADRLSESTTQ